MDPNQTEFKLELAMEAIDKAEADAAALTGSSQEILPEA